MRAKRIPIELTLSAYVHIDWRFGIPAAAFQRLAPGYCSMAVTCFYLRVSMPTIVLLEVPRPDTGFARRTGVHLRSLSLAA